MPHSQSTTARRPKSKIPSKARSKRLSSSTTTTTTGTTHHHHNHHQQSPLKTLPSVVLGNLKFPTWFENIYPEEIVPRDTETIYICQYCFRYTPSPTSLSEHLQRCDVRRQGTPPGLKVYDDGEGYAVWEIDGEKEKLYAQNLSLFAKLFLDHKSVFFDVQSFLFYILTFTPGGDALSRSRSRSASPPPLSPTTTTPDPTSTYLTLGYFSKEKLSWDPNNLACILIFPPFQRRQLGKLLMGVSYKLSAYEFEGGMVGGPERPLSEMGRRSYVRFWEERLVRFFLVGAPGGKVHVRTVARSVTAQREGKRRRRMMKGVGMGGEGGGERRMSVGDIGMAVGMLGEDVALTLKEMGILEVEVEVEGVKDKIEGSEEGEKKIGTGHGVKRKRGSNVTIVSVDENNDHNCEEKEIGVVRKSAVLEFAKKHRIDLMDPVREEGFIGEVASEEDDEEEEGEDGSDEGSDNEELIEE